MPSRRGRRRTPPPWRAGAEVDRCQPGPRSRGRSSCRRSAPTVAMQCTVSAPAITVGELPARTTLPSLVPLPGGLLVIRVRRLGARRVRSLAGRGRHPPLPFLPFGVARPVPAAGRQHGDAGENQPGDEPGRSRAPAPPAAAPLRSYRCARSWRRPFVGPEPPADGCTLRRLEAGYVSRTVDPLARRSAAYQTFG